MNLDNHIEKQSTGLLARSETLNAVVDRLNVLLNMEGKNGIRVDVSDANIVISLASGEDTSGEDLDMWVCQIIGGVPTPVLRTFLVRPEE